MRYKHFRASNVDVSAISAGTWPTGNAGYGEVTDKESIEALHAYWANGVNCVDTAPDYGTGHSEEVVGQALKGVDRSKILVATKVCASGCTLKAIRSERRYARDGRYENVMFECESSLRRLGTDYIDFYFVHWPDVDTPFDETMEALRTLKKQGKIRFIGLSNFNKQQLLECETMVQIDALQPPYSMVVRDHEDLLKWAVKHGVNTFTYGSLGAGILAGTMREVPTFGPRDPRNHFYPFYKEPYFSKIMKVIDVMEEMSKQIGKPIVQIAINWQTSHDYVSTALINARTAREAIENCGAFDWELTQEQIGILDDAIAKNLDFPGEPRRG